MILGNGTPGGLPLQEICSQTRIFCQHGQLGLELKSWTQDICMQDFWMQEFWIQNFLKHKEKGYVWKNSILGK